MPIILLSQRGNYWGFKNNMRSQAVILKKIPIKENDELVICYTKEQGKQTYRAKSVKLPSSKQRSHLEVLNLVDFSIVQGNGHPIMVSSYAMETFNRLKGSLQASALAHFLLECFDRFIFENEKDEKLWNFLLRALRQIDSAASARDRKNSDWRVMSRAIHKELLDVMGYQGARNIDETLGNARLSSLQFLNNVLN